MFTANFQHNYSSYTLLLAKAEPYAGDKILPGALHVFIYPESQHRGFTTTVRLLEVSEWAQVLKQNICAFIVLFSLLGIIHTEISA